MVEEAPAFLNGLEKGLGCLGYNEHTEENASDVGTGDVVGAVGGMKQEGDELSGTVHNAGGEWFVLEM